MHKKTVADNFCFIYIFKNAKSKNFTRHSSYKTEQIVDI